MKEQLIQVKEYPEGTVSRSLVNSGKVVLVIPYSSFHEVFMISPSQHKHDVHNGIAWNNYYNERVWRITPICSHKFPD